MPARSAGVGQLTAQIQALPADFAPLLLVSDDVASALDQPPPETTPPEAISALEPLPMLELEIASADIGRLLRAPALASRRIGRTGSVAVQTIWHDTVSGDLAALGLALSEQRGGWRLERLHPTAAADWPVATPAPILAEAPTLAALAASLPGHELPTPLIPVAAFTGRRRRMGVVGTPPGCCTILIGCVRGVATDQPTCRVILSGEIRSMATIACELAEQVALGVPRTGLAAHARAWAIGQSPAPRHFGTPVIRPRLTVAEALTLVVAHLVDVILHWVPLTLTDQSPEPVHQMRVAVRRLRSAFAIFRRAAAGPAFAEISPQLRDLARRLGEARDWDVFLAETAPRVQQAIPQERRIGAMIAAAARKRAAAYAALKIYLEDDAWRRLALRLALLPTLQPWADNPTPEQADLLAAHAQAYATRALQRRHKMLTVAGDDISGLPPSALHEIRKQAKQLRYAGEFFTALFPAKTTRRYLKRLEHLQEALGAVNDASVAAARTATLGGGTDRAYATGVIEGYMAAHSTRAGVRASRAWEKFTRQTPFWE